MASSTINWKGDAVKNKVDLAVARGMLMTMSDCVWMSKQLCPRNYGTLQRSIEFRAPVKRGRYIIGVWGSFNVNYALWVEIGTGPHMPPISPLMDWARHKLGDPGIGVAVAIKISRKGTEAQPYLRPAADNYYPRLADNIRKAG